MPADLTGVDSGTDSATEQPRKRARFKDTSRRPQSALSGLNPALGSGACPLPAAAVVHPLHSHPVASQRGTVPLPPRVVAVHVNAFAAAEKVGAQVSSQGLMPRGPGGAAAVIDDGARIQEVPQPRSSEGGVQPPLGDRIPAAAAPPAAAGVYLRIPRYCSTKLSTNGKLSP